MSISKPDPPEHAQSHVGEPDTHHADGPAAAVSDAKPALTDTACAPTAPTTPTTTLPPQHVRERTTPMDVDDPEGLQPLIVTHSEQDEDEIAKELSTSNVVT